MMLPKDPSRALSSQMAGLSSALQTFLLVLCAQNKLRDEISNLHKKKSRLASESAYRAIERNFKETTSSLKEMVET